MFSRNTFPITPYMIKQQDIFLREKNIIIQQILKIHFITLAKCENTLYLSTEEDTTHRPQKYYDKNSYELYSQFLEELYLQNPDVFIKFWIASSSKLDQALKNIDDINQKQIHDIY